MRKDIGIGRGSSIESHEIESYFPRAEQTGRYVIYGGTQESFAYLNDHKFIFAPLDSFLPLKYSYFSEQTEDLIKKGKIYPQVPDNPYFAEYLAKVRTDGKEADIQIPKIYE